MITTRSWEVINHRCTDPLFRLEPAILPFRFCISVDSLLDSLVNGHLTECIAWTLNYKVASLERFVRRRVYIYEWDHVTPVDWSVSWVIGAIIGEHPRETCHEYKRGASSNHLLWLIVWNTEGDTPLRCTIANRERVLLLEVLLNSSYFTRSPWSSGVPYSSWMWYVRALFALWLWLSSLSA